MFGLDSGSVRDKMLDAFGTSAEDSYRQGYDRGYKQKSRDGGLFGSKSGPQAESRHDYEFKRGFQEGRADRRSLWEAETDLNESEV